DGHVTGVQTCALPIFPCSLSSCTIELKRLPEGSRPTRCQRSAPTFSSAKASVKTLEMDWIEKGSSQSPAPCTVPSAPAKAMPSRSEERRVGKDGRDGR